MANKKNGGDVPPLPYRRFNGNLIQDERVLYVPVGCGKCMECKKQKARQWQVRLAEEIKRDNKGIFVTLTLSNESYRELDKEIDSRIEGYERENKLIKLATRRFLERWRKKHKKSVKHWLVTELGGGGTENIHMHGIIWTDKGGEEIEKHWKYGFVWDSDRKKGWVNEQTINYIIKYVNKTDEKHKEYNSITLTSAGIGKGYEGTTNGRNNKYKKGQTKEVYTMRNGAKINLPIYYRNKIYSEEEREKLWIEKIEKDEIWIAGVKMKASDTENVEKTRAWYQEKNKRLGYGDGTKDWDKIAYENEQTNIRRLERLRKQGYETIEQQLRRVSQKK